MRHHDVVLNAIDQGFAIIEIIFDAAGQPQDYRFLETNAAFVQHTGLSGATGRRIRELVPEIEEIWYRTYGQVALTGQPVRFVQEARDMDRWFDVYAFRVDAPEQHRVAILFTDITERTRTERGTRLLADLSETLITLTREEDLPGLIRTRTAPLFHLSQCAFVELDVGRRVALVSHSWNTPAEPAVAGTHHFDDFVAPDTWKEVVAGRTMVVEDTHQDPRISQPGRFDALHIRSFLALPLQRAGTGQHIFMLGRAEPGPWRADEIALARELGTRCWTRVERLRAENALRASEQQLRLILESAREYAIFAMDLDRRVTNWSEGAERLLGFTEEEMRGQPADIVFTPEDVAAGAPGREAETALREGRATNERWHVRKDGARIWGSGAMMTMRDANDTVCGLLKIMRDQTSVRLAQEALLQSQTQLQDALEQAQKARADAEASGRAKDQFLAALSHELRTPLNPVLMIAGDRALDRELPEPVRADFEMIRKNVELEARLIDDMLDLNRIARGKLSLHRSAHDLHAILRDVVEIVRPAAVGKSVALEARLGSSPAIVSGDAARLKQIFVNLLNNAIKFTPDGGAVTLDAALLADHREIRVAIVDTGMGMTESELARAFEPFIQGQHAEENRRSFGGLGLGLAIVRDLVDRHGGRVSAHSHGRGRGATFEVFLPLAGPDTAPTDATSPGSTRISAPAGGLRILLVEDHGHTRNALERMLTRRGYRVQSAESLNTAITAAQAERFDVIISDIGLPDGDGYELMREIRTILPGARGIALSGFGMDSDIRRSAAAGFSAHLIKPVSMKQIEAALEGLASPV